MNPKLQLDGHIYTLTVGRVLSIIVFQMELEENLYVCLAKHSIQYKVLTEPVGGFYMSPILAT